MKSLKFLFSKFLTFTLILFLINCLCIVAQAYKEYLIAGGSQASVIGVASNNEFLITPSLEIDTTKTEKYSLTRGNQASAVGVTSSNLGTEGRDSLEILRETIANVDSIKIDVSSRVGVLDIYSDFEHPLQISDLDVIVNEDDTSQLFGFMDYGSEFNDPQLIPKAFHIVSFCETFLNESSLSIYPNPVESFVNIKYEMQNAGVVNIDLYDIHGRKVQDLMSSIKKEDGLQMQQFDIGYLDSGIYYLVVTTQNKSYTKKFYKL